MATSPVHIVPESGLPVLTTDDTFYSQVMINTHGAHAQQMETYEGVEEGDKVYMPLGSGTYTHAPYVIKPERLSSTDSMPDADIDMKSWSEIHPTRWRPKDVITWVYYVCSKSEKLDMYKVAGEKFNTMTGQQLCSMSRDEFIELEPESGADLYYCLMHLLQGSNFKAPDVDLSPMDDFQTQMAFTVLPVDDNSDNSAMWCSSALVEEEPDQEMELDTCSMTLNSSAGSGELDFLSLGPGRGIVVLNNNHYEISSDDDFDGIAPYDPGYGSDDSGCTSPKVLASHKQLPPPAHCHHPMGHPANQFFYNRPYIPTCHQGHVTPRPAHEPLTHYNNHQGAAPTVKQQRPGRPPKHSGSPRGRKQGQTTKGNHLWEFIRDTINDSRYNPDYIKWENKEQGIFRIVNSAEIARMWGSKKNNNTMTYEKFSRAMRDYYKSDILRRVGSRKLVYAFGRKVFPYRILLPAINSCAAGPQQLPETVIGQSLH